MRRTVLLLTLSLLSARTLAAQSFVQAFEPCTGQFNSGFNNIQCKNWDAAHPNGPTVTTGDDVFVAVTLPGGFAGSVNAAVLAGTAVAGDPDSGLFEVVSDRSDSKAGRVVLLRGHVTQGGDLTTTIVMLSAMTRVIAVAQAEFAGVAATGTGGLGGVALGLAPYVSVATTTPGALYIGACGGVFGSVQGHFGAYASGNPLTSNQVVADAQTAATTISKNLSAAIGYLVASGAITGYQGACTVPSGVKGVGAGAIY